MQPRIPRVRRVNPRLRRPVQADIVLHCALLALLNLYRHAREGRSRFIQYAQATTDEKKIKLTIAAA